ncbi:FkbM family methyltransferase [Gillisia mitskevichiae]|uniref:FkbM family methyltransferase n=1 Tax=Gillisia mitskevichiae TaxID=270921 RepID=A0A495P5A2_9FLAO|nr:FkbM family methyltransferase [Gillisia mitskevichiae]RKS45136.1 FkbM family methyltransferase [Gillisia mitskevichiae]
MPKYNREEYILEDSPLKKDLLKLFRSEDEINILDIGGCEGEESLRYSRIFPFSKIFIFEPLPNNQKIIIENIQKYCADRIELVAKAVSDFNGVTDLYVSSGQPEGTEQFDWDFGNKSSSLLKPMADNNPKWLLFKEKIQVETTTLETFLTSKSVNEIDFVHMDVQGAELQVLCGAMNFLKNFKSIWLEVTDLALYKEQPIRNEIESFMKANGFDLVKTQMTGPFGDQFYLNKRFFNDFFIFRKFRLCEKFNQLLR